MFGWRTDSLCTHILTQHTLQRKMRVHIIIFTRYVLSTMRTHQILGVLTKGGGKRVKEVKKDEENEGSNKKMEKAPLRF